MHNLGKLALRIVIGGLFIGHGTQKLCGWFGGPGLQGTDRMMESIDMHPPRLNALAAGGTEAVGGAMLVAGCATPLAAAGLIGTMTTAIRKVHAKNGPWNANRGWEFNAVMIAALTTLVDIGPGAVSVDAAKGKVRSGPGWALAALAGGVLASAMAIARGRRIAERAQAQETVDAGTAETAAEEDAPAEHTP